MVSVNGGALALREKKTIHSLLEREAVYAGLSSVSSAFPAASYSQAEVEALFGIANPVVHRLLRASHIQRRFLYLPEVDPATGHLRQESPAELHRKFERGVLDIGVRACISALRDDGCAPRDVDYLVCVTSSGFKVPGVSSLVSRALRMRPDLHRADIVGMGCNAGMSALYGVAQYARANPGKTALLLCCEVNSASYVRDESVATGIVNSLFGDGATALVVRGGKPPLAGVGGGRPLAQIVDFQSFTLPEQHGAMRFDYDESQHKFSFRLSRDIPFVVGKSMAAPVDPLLTRHNLGREDVHHWILHTGGGAVIDAAVQSLGLSEYDVRHTRSVLRDLGNISSGSFIESFRRLEAEGRVRAGDRGVCIAMGPGATLEAALVEWA